MEEYVYWIAFFKNEASTAGKAEQSPEEMQANLMLVKAAAKKTKKVKKK